jgi:hypothetical protein
MQLHRKPQNIFLNWSSNYTTHVSYEWRWWDCVCLLYHNLFIFYACTFLASITAWYNLTQHIEQIFHLYLPSHTQEEGESSFTVLSLFSCWQGKKLAGTVQLIVKKTVRISLDHHVTLLGLVIIALTFVLVCLRIFTGRKKVSAGWESENVKNVHITVLNMHINK